MNVSMSIMYKDIRFCIVSAQRHVLLLRDVDLKMVAN